MVARPHRPVVCPFVDRASPGQTGGRPGTGGTVVDVSMKVGAMALRDDLDRAIDEALQRQPAARHAVEEGPQQKRGEAADAIQDLLAARNALLDAASRWDRAAAAA